GPAKFGLAAAQVGALELLGDPRPGAHLRIVGAGALVGEHPDQPAALDRRDRARGQLLAPGLGVEGDLSAAPVAREAPAVIGAFEAAVGDSTERQSDAAMRAAIDERPGGAVG